MSSYLQLSDDLRRETGSTSAITAVTGQTGQNARLVEWTADAALQIEQTWSDWHFLWTELSAKTLTSGTRESSLSTLSITDMGIWDRSFGSFVLNPTADNFIRLKELDYYEWRSNQKLGTAPQSAQGTPTRFVIKPDNALVFYPTPNAADTWIAEYWKTPTRMSANASTSNIPVKFERIIVVRAKMMYAEYESNSEMYQSALAEYNEMLLQLEAAELPEHHWSRQSRVDQEITVVPE